MVIFQAPKFANTDHGPAYEKLFALLDHLDPDPDRMLQSAGTADGKIGTKLLPIRVP